MRYLVTGHTGFKGTWLIKMLAEQGHEVAGVALSPSSEDLFTLVGAQAYLTRDFRGDLTDCETAFKAISQFQPEAIIHMAAQSLVLAGYDHPQLTLRSNVVGTDCVLNAAWRVGSAFVVVVVTTDKVYAPKSSRTPFVESDPLGGLDPYSASKAMSDLWAQSWAKSFEGPRVLIARAGNVIGFGDTSPHRLLPDTLRAWRSGQPVQLRHPDAIRPWQHVSDCLLGYLTLVEKADQLESGSAWNFAPDLSDHVPVRDVVSLAASYYQGDAGWDEVNIRGPHEEPLLVLDSSKSRTQLGWRPRLSLNDAVRETVLGRW